jgi:hypothetical protein
MDESVKVQAFFSDDSDRIIGWILREDLNVYSVSKSALTLCLSILIGIAGLSTAPDADAAKKSKKAAALEAEIKKTLTPLETTIDKLLAKCQSRVFFTPKDGTDLSQSQASLMALMDQYPNQPLLNRAIYQAATLYQCREMYSEAYILYSHLSETAPTTSYGRNASNEIFMLERRFGEAAFAGTTPKADVVPGSSPPAADKGGPKKP